jgi:hypothetical protein
MASIRIYHDDNHVPVGTRPALVYESTSAASAARKLTVSIIAAYPATIAESASVTTRAARSGITCLTILAARATRPAKATQPIPSRGARVSA